MQQATSTGRLAGKTAIVTGGAQSIGLAIATRLQAAGADVIVADRQPPPAAAAGLRHVPCDIADEESVRGLMAQTERLHVLVNNAGVGYEGELEQTPLQEWQRVMAVNAGGVFLCCKHAVARMRAAGGGSIINIGSIEGNGANPLHAAYAASKGAVHALTRNAALEFGPHGIRCNAIAPGWIDTPFNEKLISQFPDPDDTRRKIERLHPLRRLGAPEDIAELALFLASDESAFTTGQVFVLDGGRTACLPLPPL